MVSPRPSSHPARASGIFLTATPPDTPDDVRFPCFLPRHLLGRLGLLVEDRIRPLEHTRLDLGPADTADYLPVAIVDQFGVAGVFGPNAQETEYLGLESVDDGHFVCGVVELKWLI